MATMKELRERCAQLGIQPGRSIAETQDRIQQHAIRQAPHIELDSGRAAPAPIPEGEHVTYLPEHPGNRDIYLTDTGLDAAVDQVVQQPSRKHLTGSDIPVRHVTINPALAAPYGAAMMDATDAIAREIAEAHARQYRSAWPAVSLMCRLPANPSKRQKELMYDIQGMLMAVVPHLAQSDAIMQPFMPASQQGHMLREGACREYGGVVSRFPRAGEHHV